MDVRSKHKIEDYNALDLKEYWRKQYNKKHKEDYSTHGYGGTELKNLKQLLQDYDVYTILLAIPAALEECNSINIFCSEIEKYITNYEFPKAVFYCLTKGDKEIQHKLQDLLVLEAKWLPTANDLKRKGTIASEIYEWINTLNLD
ncbi:hypothetical protein HYS94_01645 [Candidatus Daviesbacteria bacterium]|nr:hypothetical protein [Candidatus Daviesbacteria bacterium]